MLTAVKINLEQLNSTNKNTMTVLDEAMKELRRVAHHLMPDVLQREGLNVALENFCASLPLVEYYSAGYTKRVSINLEEMLYRFAQELVNNAIKHSKATDISLQLLRDEENVTVIVCDNGIGMNKDAEKKGSGIKGIRSRLGVFHGRIDIDSVAGEGTEIHIVVPAEWNVKS
ncbi:MAG: sensor histidine kinase, partial [Phocaeicola sp.]|uniref:sensor histidine kinase n=1 Tax=Phocaeicola sp. TaxID=2773926 RepID=UPI003FA075D6